MIVWNSCFNVKIAAPESTRNMKNWIWHVTTPVFIIQDVWTDFD